MSYDQARKFSKHPEKFGTGIPDGIVASETSNNAGGLSSPPSMEQETKESNVMSPKWGNEEKGWSPP
ncbi:tripartite tricarboxylate transporter permease [Ammoniphilus sp. 3BR4]|uniref:tripartite tricarboxylate transporter permease n=1 Tax=Ammoniphilus sp. 3BR4 TaxID=3158265 RepID=UPI003467EADA